MSILGRKSKCFNSGLREKLEDIKGSNRQWIMKRPFNFWGGMLGYGFFSNSVSKFYIKISWHERSKNQLFCTTVLNKSLGKIWERKNDLWCTTINWILFRLKIKSGIQKKKTAPPIFKLNGQFFIILCYKLHTCFPWNSSQNTWKRNK